MEVCLEVLENVEAFSVREGHLDVTEGVAGAEVIASAGDCVCKFSVHHWPTGYW